MKTIKSTGLETELAKAGLRLEIVDPRKERYDPSKPVVNCHGDDGVIRPRNIRLTKADIT